MNQLDIEAIYNKQNINKWCLDEINESVVTDELFYTATQLIGKYLQQTASYKSKAARLSQIIGIHPAEIAIELFKCVLLQQETTVAHVASTIGEKFYTDVMDAVKMGAEIIGVCEPIGLYELTPGSRINGEDTASFITCNYSFNEETIQKIHTAMYLPPMITSPRDWTSNREGGLLLTNKSCILGKGNDVGQNQCYDVLNILQEITWEFNYAMLEMPELMKKGHDEPKKVKQHNDRMLHSKVVYELIQGKKFNFVWNNDKRGRSYSQGYDVNLQGSDYKKAIIQFADKEIIEGL